MQKHMDKQKIYFEQNYKRGLFKGKIDFIYKIKCAWKVKT